MSERAADTIKNHAKGFGRILLLHMLGVLLGWAAFPLFLTVLASHMTIDIPMSIYSVIASLVYAAMLISQGNEYGLTDSKPYNWARYKAKGFVLGAMTGIVVFLLTLVCIAVADRHFYVSHPNFDISNINHYIRMIFCVPFFWFYKLLELKGPIVPKVTVLTALLPTAFCSLFTGVGYIFGMSGVVVDFRPKKRKT